jgi:hypothetical protein
MENYGQLYHINIYFGGGFYMFLSLYIGLVLA